MSTLVIYLVLVMVGGVCYLVFIDPDGTAEAPESSRNKPRGEMLRTAPIMPFYPQGPVFSPDKRYVWDPVNQRWLKQPENGAWWFLLGIIIAVILLWFFGFLG